MISYTRSKRWQKTRSSLLMSCKRTRNWSKSIKSSTWIYLNLQVIKTNQITMGVAAAVSNHSRCSIPRIYKIEEVDNRWISMLWMKWGEKATQRKAQTIEALMVVSQSFTVYTNNRRKNVAKVSQTSKTRSCRSRMRKRRCKIFSWLRSKKLASCKKKFKNCNNKFTALIGKTNLWQRILRHLRSHKTTYNNRCRSLLRRIKT